MTAQLTRRPTNWAGNVTFGAARFHRPTSLEELQRTVVGSDRVRVLGTGHSFNRIADTAGDSVSVAAMPADIDLDTRAGTVRVAAGVRYGDLSARLQEAGRALHNLGSLPHISVGGACATGTHGSGDTNGNLSTAVVGLRLVTASGDVVDIDRSDADFAGSVIALGTLGVVTHLTLRTEPSYLVRQWVYERPTWEALLSGGARAFGDAYSISLFTDWRGDRLHQAWVKAREGDPSHDGPSEWLGAHPADGERASLEGAPVENGTQQSGVPGPWNERIPHYRLGFTPSRGEELQSEYMIPRGNAVAALLAVRELADLMAPVLQMSELRTVAADDLWLSPSYRQDSLAMHFTWHPDAPAVARVLEVIERALEPHGARPHWAKVFVAAPEQVQDHYDRVSEFRALRTRYDPRGVFGNDFVDELVPRA